MPSRKLLVLLHDRLSELIQKGEIVPRYYNPTDYFDEVHIAFTNNDEPDLKKAQVLVGKANLTFHRLPAPTPFTFLWTFGFRPMLLKFWGQNAVKLANEIQPDLVRCYGHFFNAFAGWCIQQKLGIPYIISLHGNPDVDYYRGRLARTFLQKIWGRAVASMEQVALRNADYVLPVYSPIVPFLKKSGIKKYQVVHNAVGYGRIVKKDYEQRGMRFRCVCIGRQVSLQKDPTPIVEAVADMPQVDLLLVGTGDLHDPLRQWVKERGLEDRIQFKTSLLNEDLMRDLHTFDAFVYSSINFEISKATIEAALVGLPILLNNRNGFPAEELLEGPFLLVDGTTESYKRGLEELMRSSAYREDLGNRIRAYAEALWAPEAMEAKIGEIYRSFPLTV